ncbi:NUDIX hydrolase [Derxia gummosa]|uniref:NUDIX hydrolase n=1 Tax=Derxia gummosa DSM 723 TaxID=1121388 RepID=A0A8B6X873_9BURK|nr:NUDIX hydrolase [Derxia gummosa]
MNYCSHCGHALSMRIPDGDNRIRHCCDNCGTIHYANPKLVLGTLPYEGQRVLLCRRAIEPRHGFWTLPGGFMENGETLSEGALRETDEEAGARVEIGPLFSVLDVVHVHQVHVFYLARLLSLDFAPGPESLEVRMFAENEIPWDDIAFRTTAMTLRAFFDDLRQGTFMLHTGRVQPAHAPHAPHGPL